MVAIAEADGNGADLADWAASTRSAVELGEEFSQHLPIADSEACNQHRRAYRGPVVVIVYVNTFSCGDLFAAGILDHGIGTILSVGTATGAGGANVWTSDDIEYAYHAARRPLPPIPAGITFSIAVRRMTRTGLSTDWPSRTSASTATMNTNSATTTSSRATSTSPNAPPDSS